MHIGFASPFVPQELTDLLDCESRKKVAQVVGVWATPVTALVRELHKRGHGITVFALDPGAKEKLRLAGERLVVHVLPARPLRKCVLDVYLAERRLLREAILAERPEVISAQWTREHALGALSTGFPTAVTCHDTPLRYAWISKGIFMWYHLPIAWWVIRKAALLICVSPYTAQHIKRFFWPRAPVEVIPNGLPPEVFERGARRLARGRAVSGAPFTFCSVGRWGRMKNIAALLEAFARVRRARPDTRLVLFGPGLGPAEAAEQWARSRGLDQSVEFRGSASREKILDFLEAEADMMVHPSLVETHGMTIIEAMACGVPVVGGLKSGAVPWTLEHGRCGYLCDVTDPDSIARTMLEAMSRGPANAELAQRAYESVRNRFPIESVAEAYERIFARLARGGACGAARSAH
ncbi:MAG: glycosyltransferase family 4 protein [Verrucomicrobiae bacterium]|nr:glycosyltransferase family 4 protein [Verrucomicrobiae bacterium]